ncbi:MAG: HesA/MoeB/ThiF family protein [Chloroflexi bacterium]|nr:HesA/MoeB/ThiF family protein [Chloroflexota bacterium]
MLTSDELTRYSRQIIYNEFGESGQEKLKKSHVVIAGAGGLGCPASTYLAYAGIGQITIIDNENIELSNLNRQILHWTENIGQKKVVSASDKLSRINPSIKIIPRQTKITEANSRDLIMGADVVIDALDNIETRLLLNHACMTEGIPLIHGGVYGLYGQVTTIIPGQTPCLACIFLKKERGEKPFPVFGVTPAIIAAIQSTEAIKLIAGFGQLITGKMLYIDLVNMKFIYRDLIKNPACEVCNKDKN